jgi:hypothetical protein
MHFGSIPIRMEWFYNMEGGKIKLNWFLLEIALDYYDRIRSSPALSSYLKQYDERQRAQFCTYFSRRLKKSVLECIHGHEASVVIYPEHIDDFYPHHTPQMNKALTKAATDTVIHMLSACKKCPQGCLSEYSAKTTLFDDWKE